MTHIIDAQEVPPDIGRRKNVRVNKINPAYTRPCEMFDHRATKSADPKDDHPQPLTLIYHVVLTPPHCP